jgi:N6-adenosine-specific RNA methylase IME4
MFSNLKSKHYGVIYADPPWLFNAGGNRNAKNHYNVMSIKDIQNMPVGDIAADNCVLLMWTTDPTLDQGIETMKMWGFKYKTVGFYWVKQNKSGNGFFKGLGYWTRANPEICLLGVKGRVKRKNKNIDRLVIAPRREHSRKPDIIYDRIENLVDGPYVELFARNQRLNWDSWGNQINKFSQENIIYEHCKISL